MTFGITARYHERRQPEIQSQSKQDIVAAVGNALDFIRPELKTIIKLRYWNQLSLRQIALYAGISPLEAKARLIQAHNALRPILVDFVSERWHFKPRGVCLICGHIKRQAIDKMLLQKNPKEAWGDFGEKLAEAIGEKIHPPRILIVHMAHIQRKDSDHA